MGDTSTKDASDLSYEQWNSEVSQVLKTECPSLHTEYYTQLGGGCQAVVFGLDSADKCAGVTDECVCIYDVNVKDLWASDEENIAIAYFPFDTLPKPANAAAVALAVLMHHSIEMDAETLGDIAIADVWGDYEWMLMRRWFPGIFYWHHNSSQPYYIKQTMQQAMFDDARFTAIYHHGGDLTGYGAWSDLATITAQSTTRSMLRRMVAGYTK